jgi:hypothetical protein
MATIRSGDVIEFEGPDGPTSALVLLASDESLIIDLLDGRTPWAVRADELASVRVFDQYLTIDRAA